MAGHSALDGRPPPHGGSSGMAGRARGGPKRDVLYGTGNDAADFRPDGRREKGKAGRTAATAGQRYSFRRSRNSLNSRASSSMAYSLSPQPPGAQVSISSRRAVSSASRAREISAEFSTQMSSHISLLPAAIRVVSRKPFPIIPLMRFLSSSKLSTAL